MADNCGSAGGCVCGCKLNKHISCLAGKGHCGNHSTGCHEHCSPPAGQSRQKPGKKPAAPGKPRIGRTQGGQGWCDCTCSGCKTNKNHCHRSAACKAPKPERGGGGGRGKSCSCKCTDCKRGIGCGTSSCGGH